MNGKLTDEEVKNRINSLLWVILPDTMTLADAEVYAFKMFQVYQESLKPNPVYREGV